MIEITIRELINLVSSQVSSPEVRLEKVFEWAHSRRMALAKSILTASAAFFVSLAVAFLKGDTPAGVSTWWVVASLFGAVLFAVFGLALLVRAKQLHKSYIDAVSLLGSLQALAPFFARYREEIQQ